MLKTAVLFFPRLSALPSMGGRTTPTPSTPPIFGAPGMGGRSIFRVTIT
jgi:hypothetical protein